MPTIQLPSYCEQWECGPNDVLSASQSKISSALSLPDTVKPWSLQSILDMAKEEADISAAMFSAAHVLIALYRNEENELSAFLHSKEVTLKALRDAVKELDA